MMGWRVSTYCDCLSPLLFNLELLIQQLSWLNGHNKMVSSSQVWYYLTYPQIHHSDNPVVENMYSNMPVLSLEPHTLSDDVNNAGPPGIW